MDDLAIDVYNLNKSFAGKQVVKGVSLQIKKGEIFGFLGPNGSGKTTCIRMLCGLLKPDEGAGHCLGLDILQQSSEIKKKIGYMTQRFSFWKDLTIQENLDFVAQMYELPQRKQRVKQTLQELDLTDRAAQITGTLSGGWQQRLALAACLLHKPQVLLLDEPTAGVDPSARRDFWERLHHLAAQGIAILVSTHYMDEAERCHKLAYIADGELLVTGTGREIIESLGLSSWSVRGDGLNSLYELASHEACIDQVIVFGDALHISAKDTKAAFAAIQRLIDKSGQQVEPINTGLEHVFIYLMSQRKAQASALQKNH